MNMRAVCSHGFSNGLTLPLQSGASSWYTETTGAVQQKQQHRLECAVQQNNCQCVLEL
jgi:hypothetical protein